MDQLATDYAGQPVVFLEYDIDNAPYSRYGRWWAAYGGGGSVYLPLIMVDSGHQISNGYLNFYNVYKAMVDTELARPPQAEIQAQWWRTGDKVGFYAQVKNLSPAKLSSGTNSASVHAIVYEDAKVKVTNRFVRAAVETGISDLAPNADGRFHFGNCRPDRCQLGQPALPGPGGLQSIRLLWSLRYAPGGGGPACSVSGPTG